MSKKRVFSKALGAAALSTGLAGPVEASITPTNFETNTQLSQKALVGVPDLVLDFVLLSKNGGIEQTLNHMFQGMGPNQAQKLPDFYLSVVQLDLVADKTELIWSLLRYLESSEHIDNETFKTTGERLIDLHSMNRIATIRLAADLGSSCEGISLDPRCTPLTTDSIGDDGPFGGSYDS